MSQVTVSELRSILECSLTESEIQTFLNMTDVLVEEVLAGQGMEARAKKEIQRWLTAHLISISRVRFTSQEKVGDASVSYAGTWGENLKATSYGQMVLMLDTSGRFAERFLKKVNVKAM